MKTWHSIFLLTALLLMVFTQAAGAQATPPQAVPKYDPATEATLKGTIIAISERNCPVSGTLGFHFVLKLEDGKTLEVHVAASQMMKTYEITLNKGDQVEVTGSKVKFGGEDTILARQVVRGNDIYVFRDKNGKPAW
jgi:DNA/RNA endonuclease YhcR with UshA esterase domain